MLNKFFVFILICTFSTTLYGQETTEAEKKVEARLTQAYSAPAKPKKKMIEHPLAKSKANKKHDRVTIEITESVSAKQEATTELSKESSATSTVNKWFTIKKGKNGYIAKPVATSDSGDGSNKPEVDVDMKRDHTSDGTIERNTDFDDTISGEVVDVLPNGQMIIEAKKTMKIGDEETAVTLTGRVDPKDLSADSEVNANKIINLTVKFKGKGAITDTQKRGWFARFVDKINPF